jgi:hypothetical protein
MASRLPQIRSEWLSRNVHTLILEFVRFFPKSGKVIGNLAFALSALTFEESDACLDVIKKTELTYQLLDCTMADSTNRQSPNI